MSDNPRWLEDAACRGMDTALFFPERGDNLATRAALEVCGRCRVRDACLDYALEHFERHGIWGGETQLGRRRMRRIRREAGGTTPDGDVRCPEPGCGRAFTTNAGLGNHLAGHVKDRRRVS